jgi:transcriptional regulator with XRE-family HTH domain
MSAPAVKQATIVRRSRHGPWLRSNRKARGWTAKQMASRLQAAASLTADKQVPSTEYLIRSIRRWERGAVGVSERYQLYFCAAFGLPPGAFCASAHHAPWRLLVLDRDSDSASPDPRWIIATITLPEDVMPASLTAGGDFRDWERVREWVQHRTGTQVALAPATSSSLWRIGTDHDEHAL